MPPHSRGQSGREQTSSPVAESDSHPPTLKPFLDTLPPPTEIIADQRTPTLRPSPEPLSTDSPSPDRPYQDDDESSIGEDEEEFASHYSRNSPASTDDELDDDDVDADYPSISPTSPAHPSDRLQRVASLPVTNPQRPPLPHSYSTASLRPPPPPLPPPLYPPFYNRPPTPLPPSPSLTSLLRPPSILNRSTTSTRPTTPDSSDVETPLDNEAAVAHSARRAHPLPPTSPKVPTYEYYGFTLYLASTLAFIMYLLWSYLPSPFLHALGITYYPNRWWSLAIPAWIVMLLVWIYVALACYNVEYLTLGLERVECLVDETGNVAVLDEKGRIRKGGSKRWETEREFRRHEAVRRAREGKKKATTPSATTGRGSQGKGSARRKKDLERKKTNPGGGSVEGSYYPAIRQNSTDRASASWMDDDAPEENDDDFLAYVTQYGPGNDTGVGMDLSWKQIWNQGTDAVMDVPIGGVCQVLYGEEDY